MIAYAAIFSALYLLLSYSSSTVFGPLFRGSEAHCFRAMTMALIAARLAYPGGPIIMSVVSGFLLLFVPRERQNKLREALKKYREFPFFLEPDGSKIIFNIKSEYWK